MNSELAASNRTVAAQTGLNDSDLAVLDILHREGPQTPTALARRTRMGDDNDDERATPAHPRRLGRTSSQ